MLAVVAIYLIFAVGLIVLKSAFLVAQPLFLQGSRLICAGLALTAYAKIRYPDKMRISRDHVSAFLEVALFLYTLNYSLAVLSMDDLSSARFAFLLNLSPFLAAFFSYLYLGELLTKKKIIGLCIGLLGFLPLFFAGQTADGSESLFSVSGLQASLSLVCFIYGLIVARRLVKKEEYNPYWVNGVCMLIGGIGTLFCSLMLEGWSISPVTDFPTFLFYLLIIVVVGDIIGYNRYVMLLKRYSATFLAFAGFLYPVFSAILGWVLLGEQVTQYFVISSFIVACGLYVFYSEEIHEQEGDS